MQNCSTDQHTTSTKAITAEKLDFLIKKYTPNNALFYYILFLYKIVP